MIPPLVILFAGIIALSACTSQPHGAGKELPRPESAVKKEEKNDNWAIESIKRNGPPVTQETPELFAENLADIQNRFDRLEAAVQQLREDYDVLAPAISRIVAIDQDLSRLTLNIEKILSNDYIAPPNNSVPPLTVAKESPVIQQTLPTKTAPQVKKSQTQPEEIEDEVDSEYPELPEEVSELPEEATGTGYEDLAEDEMYEGLSEDEMSDVSDPNNADLLFMATQDIVETSSSTNDDNLDTSE
jgi:hypothetical protein